MLEDEYEARKPALGRLRDAITKELEELLLPDPLIERISGRVKSTDQFVKKAAKRLDNGSPKYAAPLNEIQDQVGVRIIVRFDGERGRVRDAVVTMFRPIEDRFKEPEDSDRFGYEATHLVCLVPPDLRHSTESPIDFFEVQICTLFQHAWAECNHDVGYKAIAKLTRDDERRIALAAANAWGADRIFEEMRRRGTPSDRREPAGEEVRA